MGCNPQGFEAKKLLVNTAKYLTTNMLTENLLLQEGLEGSHSNIRPRFKPCIDRDDHLLDGSFLVYRPATTKNEYANWYGNPNLSVLACYLAYLYKMKEKAFCVSSSELNNKMPWVGERSIRSYLTQLSKWTSDWDIQPCGRGYNVNIVNPQLVDALRPFIQEQSYTGTPLDYIDSPFSFLILVFPGLAQEFGLCAALILQYTHYMSLCKTAQLKDGHKVFRHSVSRWTITLAGFSAKTIERALRDLRDKGLLLTTRSQAKRDRTLWYRVDYDRLYSWV